MKRGEVWWVEFDPSVGSEIRKRRPAVIVSNDAANRHLARVIVVPLTSNTERQYPGEAVVTVGGQSSKAMADQIMAADKSRSRSQLGEPSRTDMLAIEDARSRMPSRFTWRCRGNGDAWMRRKIHRSPNPLFGRSVRRASWGFGSGPRGSAEPRRKETL
ncbi:type II toxin-antitoxin system PemK/MazF family toxin [Verminephrobacter eiseniae]|uniref:type II toxin-antitoxin system PemK/MazF family toxin n=1 Tax=Verminephrobacter eiseniae TaxID=364317 RepID=UPI002237B1AE|nr:type II toxin-antitoxin system PemK/MazF family toxin [Verminephrobacter eiseniae]